MWGAAKLDLVAPCLFTERGGVTAYELDRVMGDRAAIMQLVQAVPGQLYGYVTFRTVYEEVALVFHEANKSSEGS